MSKPGKPKASVVPDDVKAKMKAALERKQAHDAGGDGGEPGAGSKVSREHGAESSQKSFRRKSG